MSPPRGALLALGRSGIDVGSDMLSTPRTKTAFLALSVSAKDSEIQSAGLTFFISVRNKVENSHNGPGSNTLCCRSFGTFALIFSISRSNVDGL